MPLLQCEYDRRGRKRPPPAEPCAAPPGSPEKLRVLELRASRGEQLWHPRDCRELPDVPDRPARANAHDIPAQPLPRGVEINRKSRKPFRACVWIPPTFARRGRRVHLGYFRTAEAAGETARRARALLAARGGNGKGSHHER